MSIVQYRSDGTTPLGGVSMTNVEGGGTSDVLEVVLVNEGSDRYDVPIVQRTQDPITPSILLAKGVPPQDEMWGRFRIKSSDNSNTVYPDWSHPATDFRPLGAYGGEVIPFWPAGGILTCELKMTTPGTSSPNTYRIHLRDAGSLKALPMPTALGRYDHGILTGIGDTAVSYALRGLALSETGGGADEYANLAAGTFVHQGRLVGITAKKFELDQDDGSAATLGSGESYLALLTFALDGTPTITKGDKAAADPAEPTAPAGEWRHPENPIRVDYTGGTSEIETVDILGEMIYGRYHVEADSGLTVDIHAGWAIAGGTVRYSTRKEPLLLTDDSDCYLWQLSSGLWQEVDDDALTPPEETADGPHFKVTTAAGAITAIEDLRHYAGGEHILRLYGEPAATGEFATALVAQHHLYIEDIIYRFGSNGGGAAGSTILDLHVDGTTIYTERTTDDQRPTLAYDGTNLIQQGHIHEVTEIRQGQVLSLQGDAFPDSDSTFPSWVEALVICRRA